MIDHAAAMDDFMLTRHACTKGRAMSDRSIARERTGASAVTATDAHRLFGTED